MQNNKLILANYLTDVIFSGHLLRARQHHLIEEFLIMIIVQCLTLIELSGDFKFGRHFRAEVKKEGFDVRQT